VTEPIITINGTLMGQGHAIALRAAVSRMLEAMEDPDALGDDAMGRRHRQSYIDRLTELQVLLHTEPPLWPSPVYKALDPKLPPGIVLLMQDGREVGRIVNAAAEPTRDNNAGA